MTVMREIMKMVMMESMIMMIKHLYVLITIENGNVDDDNYES